MLIAAGSLIVLLAVFGGFVLRDGHLAALFQPYEVLMIFGEEDASTPVGAIQKLADAMPAFGIVAAVMGVVHTMGAIGRPPTELGALIAAALVGTFVGILLSYGFVAPLASLLQRRQQESVRAL